MSVYINLITISRILLAPVIMLYLIFGNYLVCLFLFFIAGLSDYFDGYLARKYKLESQLGEILDPIADKILIIFILVGLSVNLDSYLIAFMSSFIISREIGVSALRDYAARNNMSNRTKVTFLAKTKTAVQLFSIALYLFALTINSSLLIIIGDIVLIAASLITIYTGYQYASNIFKR